LENFARSVTGRSPTSASAGQISNPSFGIGLTTQHDVIVPENQRALRPSPRNSQMKHFIPTAAVVMAAVIGLVSHEATAAPKLTGKISGLHIGAAAPPWYGGHTRLPRVVRNFNPKQSVRGPKKDIGLARRR
jgi:hypothetical protein